MTAAERTIGPSARAHVLRAALRAEYALQHHQLSSSSLLSTAPSRAAAALCALLSYLLFPRRYGEAHAWWRARRTVASAALELAEERLDSTLPYALGAAGGASATVVGRVKSARSVFEKAALRGKQVNDLVALRVVIGGAAEAVDGATEPQTLEGQ